MLFTTLTALFALAAGVVAQRLTKPPLNPAIDSRQFVVDIMATLHPKGWHHDTWGKGWLPGGCVWLANVYKYNLNDIEAFNIYINDCPNSWVFCRHKDAPLSQKQIIDYFARLPVGMRDEVRHVLFAPGERSGVSWGDNIVLWGAIDIGTMIHEIGHNCDRGYGPSGGVYGQPWYTTTAAWLNEYNKDECIPDPYAANNMMEDWASVIGLALYDKVVPGGLGRLIPTGWPKIFHQYATCQYKLGKALIPGGTCNRRWINDAPVSTNKRSRVGPAPAVQKRSGSELESDIGTIVPRSAVRHYYDENSAIIRSEVENYDI